jgi:hypothetical protein
MPQDIPLHIKEKVYMAAGVYKEAVLGQYACKEEVYT